MHGAPSPFSLLEANISTCIECCILLHATTGRISPTLLNERKSAIEARVVHLMKKAGTLRHDKLIEGVLEHTRRMNFVPPVDFICEVIRSDIEKDFIELTEDGPNPLYRYQA